jgi:hypothetical protein
MRLVTRGGRYHLVGQVMNADSDPAYISLWGTLLGNSEPLAVQALGDVAEQRLLPAETTGVRIDFEGVLSLRDAELAGTFDPKLYLPLELARKPDGARVEARALVHGTDLYHDIIVTGTHLNDTNAGIILEGLAVNAGMETVSVARIVALLYDDKGAPIWVEAGYVTDNLMPGQSAPFHIVLPRRDEIAVVSDVDSATAIVNGSLQQADLGIPGAKDGTIPITIPGYSALRLQVSSMTYDPLF